MQSSAAQPAAALQPPPAAAVQQQQAAQKAALSEISAAFGGLLRDLQFSFVISSARAQDMPIVYASSTFYSCTGYQPAEVLGRNCRFLQGPATSHHSVMEIRDAIREERACSICLLNYRKDKTPFHNYFRLEPVRGADGLVEYFIGVQADVTRLVEAGGGAALDALAQQGAAHAASVAQRLTGHEAELKQADHTQKCAALGCVPCSLLSALARVQDCFVLSDPNLPDCPIVFASQRFLDMTGYSCNEVVGRNCRFLQGPGTDPATVQQLREALAAEPPRPVTVTLLNYRKPDASGHRKPFWNSLHICPLRDADGKVQFFAGVQMELTDEAEATAPVEAAAANGAHAAEEAAEAPAAAAAGAAGAGVGAGAEAAAEVVAGVLSPPEPDPLVLLRQKGVVGSLRVATRALAQHGLRRAAQFQHQPSKAD